LSSRLAIKKDMRPEKGKYGGLYGKYSIGEIRRLNKKERF